MRCVEPMRKVDRLKQGRAPAEAGRLGFGRLGAMTALLVLAGCEVGPDFKAPQSSLMPFHNTAAMQASLPNAPPALSNYWEGFEDPVLDTVISQALAQNLDLAAALGRVHQAEAQAGEAGAQLLPSADFTTQAAALHQSLYSPIGEIGNSFPGYNRDQRLYDIGAAASWEIDLFGGLRRGAEAASAEAQAAAAEQAGTRVIIVAEAADAYFQIRGDQARLAVAQQQIDTDGQLVDLVRRRLQAGAATTQESDEAEALLYQAESAVPPLRTALEAQDNRLDILLGAQPGSYARTLPAAPQSSALPPLPAAETPEQMLEKRPDIMAAQARLRAANAEIGVAISQYYPKISLAGILGFESLDAGQLFTSAAFQPQVVAGLRWRLFDFGKVNDEVQQSRGSYAEQLAAYRNAVLNAAGDVENALMALAQDEQAQSLLQQEQAALTGARDNAQRSYSDGAIALTDVLDADRELLQTQDRLAWNQSNIQQDSVALFRAFGGGW